MTLEPDLPLLINPKTICDSVNLDLSWQLSAKLSSNTRDELDSFGFLLLMLELVSVSGIRGVTRVRDI